MDWLVWCVFLALALVAVGGAVGFLVTMSMYRAALSLMSTFVALAGMFVLLDAELLAAVQMMMNVGGMLVMALFMVLMMMDPGGQSMWQMKRDMRMRGPGALSMHAPRGAPPQEEHQREHFQMKQQMAMSTTQLPWALAVGALSAVLLGAVAIFTAWPVATGQAPMGDDAREVGMLLLSRYMLGFEGAAFLILGGIAAAVILGLRDRDVRQARQQHRQELARQGDGGKHGGHHGGEHEEVHA